LDVIILLRYSRVRTREGEGREGRGDREGREGGGEGGKGREGERERERERFKSDIYDCRVNFRVDITSS